MPSETEAIFADIYRRKVWHHGESVSGNGSSLEQTAAIREALPGLFRELQISSILDVPCGDFNWMRHVDLSGVQYTGADIVADMIAFNCLHHERAGVYFQLLNLITSSLPRADLVLCRDCLVHLPLADACRAIVNIRASGATYLLATTFPGRTHNRDCRAGEWRPLNLSLTPFNLGEPMRLIDERCPEAEYADKSLGLWRINVAA